ncbi:MAG: hypothetical protein Q9181_007796 [Wetmoreana brouardii]
MARCSLLLDNFWDSPGMHRELANWATEAKEQKEALKDTEYLVRKNLDDVEDLCTEMRGRILAERSCDSLNRTGNSPKDMERRRAIRMSITWPKATDGWFERRKTLLLDSKGELVVETSASSIEANNYDVWGVFDSMR